MCLSIISTFTDMCEISSATVFSGWHPIPNQMMMLDAGCPHRNDRGIAAADSRLKAWDGCRGGERGPLSIRGGSDKSHSFQPGWWGALWGLGMSLPS